MCTFINKGLPWRYLEATHAGHHKNAREPLISTLSCSRYQFLVCVSVDFIGLASI